MKNLSFHPGYMANLNSLFMYIKLSCILDICAGDQLFN